MPKNVKQRKEVVLDTNFLLIPGQFGVDIFTELERVCDFSYETVVLDVAVAELEELAKDKGSSLKDRKAAQLGLQLIKAKKARILRADRKVFKTTDKAILDFASANKERVIVATQDKALRKKLEAEGVKVVILRQRQHLQFYN